MYACNYKISKRFFPIRYKEFLKTRNKFMFCPSKYTLKTTIYLPISNGRKICHTFYLKKDIPSKAIIHRHNEKKNPLQISKIICPFYYEFALKTL